VCLGLKNPVPSMNDDAEKLRDYLKTTENDDFVNAIEKRLFTGTVPANKNYITGTVPANESYVTGTVGGGGRQGGRVKGGSSRGWERVGELYIASVGSRAGGDNRKRARSAQRRVGPKAGAPAPGSPVRASFP
jgi:hypothetical protein